MADNEKEAFSTSMTITGFYFVAGCVALSRVSDSFRFVVEGSATVMLFAGVVWGLSESFIVHRAKGPLLSGKKYYFVLWVLWLALIIYYNRNGDYHG